MTRRKRTAVGIDISRSGMCVVQLRTGKSMQVESMNSELLPDGVIDPDGSTDWDQLEDYLRRTLEPISLRTRHVSVSIPTEFTVVRQLHLPNYSNANLRRVIEFELTQSIHLPFEDPVFDFVRTSTGQSVAKGENVNILLVAADRTFVDGLLRILMRQRLHVDVLDLRPLANHRVLSHVVSLPKTFLCVEDEMNSTYVHVYHEGQLYLSRRLPDESEPLEKDASLGTEIDSVRFEQFRLELERTIDFFRYTLMQRDAVFDEIIISGHYPHPHAQLLANEVASRMGVVASVFSFQRVLESRKFSMRRGLVPLSDEEHDYTTAIGLAMRGV